MAIFQLDKTSHKPHPGLALDDSGQFLYWSGATSDSVSVLDLSTRTNIGTLDLGGRPRGMVWDQDRGVAFVAFFRTRQKLSPSIPNCRSSAASR